MNKSSRARWLVALAILAVLLTAFVLGVWSAPAFTTLQRVGADSLS